MGKKRDSLALAGGGGGLFKETEQRRGSAKETEHRRKDDLIAHETGPTTGEAAKEHKKKKKKHRERPEEQAATPGPVQNGVAAPSQKSPAEKDKDKKVRKEPALQGGAEGRSLALVPAQQGGVGKALALESGGVGGSPEKTESKYLVTAEKKRKDPKDGGAKAGDKRERAEKGGPEVRAALKAAGDRSPALEQLQLVGIGKAMEKGVEKGGGPETEGGSEKKRKKKREGEGKNEAKDEGGQKTRDVEQPSKAFAAAEAGGGALAPAVSPMREAGADVSKVEPETGAGVETGKVEGAEEKTIKRRAKQAGVKGEGGGNARAKKGADEAREKRTDRAAFDGWGKFFEEHWQGFFWPSSSAPGTAPAADHPGGTKRKGGDHARPETGGQGEERQGAGKGGKKSKRQKKAAKEAGHEGPTAEPEEKDEEGEEEEGAERRSSFLIRGPLPCHVAGCRHPARYGTQEEGAKFVPDSCSQHKAPGMKEMKKAVCEVAGCTKTAHYKYADEKGKSRCSGHKEEGMVK